MVIQRELLGKFYDIKSTIINLWHFSNRLFALGLILLPKVAIVGNQNNNHFVLQRYLFDLGIEADLFIFKDESEHFLPVHDTWDITRWEKRIYYLAFGNNLKDCIITNKRKIRTYFKYYDVIIGNGYSPFFFKRAELRLDIFKYYGADLYELPFPFIKLKNFKNLVKFVLAKFYVAPHQRLGIIDSRIVVGYTIIDSYRIALKRLGKKNIELTVPQVYNKEKPNLNIEFPFIKLMDKSDFIVFNHSRQIWKTFIDSASSKGNNILIHGFKLFLECTSKKNPLLVLFNYGIDVSESKSLIKSLGIESKVLWIDLLPRKIILFLLSKYATVGSDQFIQGSFGSTGYEVLSQGVPLLSFIKISNKQYEEKLGIEPPPVLNVKDEIEVKNALIILENDEYLSRIRKQSLEWFNKYNGQELAEKWKDLIVQLYEEKSKE